MIAHCSPVPPKDVCPTCGQRYPEAKVRAPFVPRTSGLLDLVLIIKDATAALKAALETEMLP